MVAATEYFNFTKSTNTSVPVDQSIALTTTPQAVIFYGTYQTATGKADDFIFFFGASAGVAADERGVCSSSEDNVGTSNCNGRQAAKSITILDASGTLVAEADWKNFTDGAGGAGVTLTWTTNDAVALIIHGFAYSGLRNQHVFDLTTDSTATVGDTDDETGFGFDPVDGETVVILFHASADGSIPATFINLRVGLGLAKAADERAYVSTFSQDNVATMNTGKAHGSSLCSQFLFVKSGSVADAGAIDFDSWITDGIRIKYDSVPAANIHLFGLVLDAASDTKWKIEEYEQRLTTGIQHFNPGISPTGIFDIYQPSTVADEVINATAILGCGAASAVGVEGSVHAFDAQAGGTSNAFQGTQTDKVVTSTEGAGITNTADVVKMGSFGFSYDFTIVQGDPHRHWYLVCGSAGGVIRSGVALGSSNAGMY